MHPIAVRSSSDIVLLVDDDTLIRDLLQSYLTAHLPHVVFLTAAAGADAIQIARARPISAVLLDLTMPGMDGWQVAAELRSLPSPPQIVMLTAMRNGTVVSRAAKLSLAGFVWKPCVPAERLVDAVRTVLAGGRYFCSEFSAELQRIKSDTGHYLKQLSDRELELLPGLGYGLNDATIARISNFGRRR